MFQELPKPDTFQKKMNCLNVAVNTVIAITHPHNM